MGSPSTPSSDTSPNHHLIGALLATKELSLTWTAAIEDAVGHFYTDNVVVAALGALRDHPCRPRDLEPVTRRRSASVTRIVNRLEDHGDVRRGPRGLAADHRGVLVRITGQGRRSIDAVAAVLVDRVDEVRAPIGEALGHLGAIVTTTNSGSDVEGSPVDVTMTLAGLGIAIADQVADSLDGLDVNAVLALGLLAQVPQARPSTLSDRLGLTSGGMTKLLDRVESQALIVRDYGRLGTDRRAVEVALTPEGAERLDRFLTRVRPHAAELYGAFASFERRLAYLSVAS